MTLVRVSTQAQAELREITHWYALQAGPKVKARWIAEVRKLRLRLADNPCLYPPVSRLVRRAVLARFPYLVFYTVGDADVLIVGFIHSAQDPSRWPLSNTP